MKKNNTNLILTISIISFIILSVVFVYLLNVIKNKNEHASVVSNTLKNKTIEKGNLDILEKRMTELLDTQKKINSYLVDTSNIDKFVEYLENIGINNNASLSVKSVDFLKNDKNKMVVSLTIRGDFSGVMKTFSILENSPYDIVIDSLYLNKEISQYGDISQQPVNSLLKNKKVIISPKSSWQMDISFNVLSL